MACYVELAMTTPNGGGYAVLSAFGSTALTLTSGAAGTTLVGSGETLVVNSDLSGWIHVSNTVNTDKAAVGKTRRIIANIPNALGGVGAGMFVSFLAD